MFVWSQWKGTNKNNQVKRPLWEQRNMFGPRIKIMWEEQLVDCGSNTIHDSLYFLSICVNLNLPPNPIQGFCVFVFYVYSIDSVGAARNLKIPSNLIQGFLCKCSNSNQIQDFWITIFLHFITLNLCQNIGHHDHCSWDYVSNVENVEHILLWCYLRCCHIYFISLFTF